MYQYITGKVSEITPEYLTLDKDGIGFLLHVPNPYRFQIDEVLTIYVDLIVREDSHTLYGFKNKTEKDMFKSLLKVTGIGPKSALAILSTSTPNEVVAAIENEDQTYLQKFPGIGKKTASQIILDLKGKLVTAEEKTVVGSNEHITEAILALEALGYSKRELSRLEKHLKTQDLESVDAAVKAGLKYLVQ